MEVVAGSGSTTRHYGFDVRGSLGWPFWSVSLF